MKCPFSVVILVVLLVSSAYAQDCARLASCTECLMESADCGHWQQENGCFSACLIADIACFTTSTLPNSTIEEICQTNKPTQICAGTNPIVRRASKRPYRTAIRPANGSRVKAPVEVAVAWRDAVKQHVMQIQRNKTSATDSIVSHAWRRMTVVIGKTRAVVLTIA